MYSRIGHNFRRGQTVWFRDQRAIVIDCYPDGLCVIELDTGTRTAVPVDELRVAIDAAVRFN